MAAARAAGVHPSHSFRAGTWTVTLTVTDNVSGLSNSVSHKVTIGAAVCVVPALKGKTLAGARGALRSANCALGQVTAPKRPSGRPGKAKSWVLVVIKQSARRSGVHPKGFAVRVTCVWRALAG
jgi:hypothetical protein